MIGIVVNVLGRINLLSRLMIVVAVATVPALLVMVYLQHSLREEGRARIADEALRQAELLNADMSSVVEGARQTALAITHFAAVRAGDPACRANLAGLRADLPSYAVLSVVAEDGAVICSSDPGAPQWADAPVLAHLRAVFDKGTLRYRRLHPADPDAWRDAAILHALRHRYRASRGGDGRAEPGLAVRPSERAEAARRQCHNACRPQRCDHRAHSRTTGGCRGTALRLLRAIWWTRRIVATRCSRAMTARRGSSAMCLRRRFRWGCMSAWGCICRACWQISTAPPPPAAA